MANRFLAFCWSASVGLALCLFATFYVLGSSRYAYHHFDSEITRITSRTVVIGSSITGRAFPPILSNEDNSLLKGVTRWTVPGISFRETLYLSERALEKKIDRVLIEAGPLLRVMNVGDPNRSLLQTLLRTTLDARVGLKLFFKLKIDFGGLQKEFPPELMRLTFRPTEDFKEDVDYSFLDWKISTEINVLIDQARSKNIAIVLLSYPRAESSMQTSYHRSDLEVLREETRQFAEHYGLAYFSPDLLWDDAFFTDRSHFNARGRERYLQELENWWAAR
jgi:hypothetical protein